MPLIHSPVLGVQLGDSNGSHATLVLDADQMEPLLSSPLPPRGDGVCLEAVVLAT